MKPEIKRELVKALRSGKYQQGRGVLCDHTGAMCCLGVLMDVAIDTYWEHLDIFTCWSIEGAVVMPTRKQLEAVGLSPIDANTLSEMNDEGKTFAEIADWIEVNL